MKRATCSAAVAAVFMFCIFASETSRAAMCASGPEQLTGVDLVALFIKDKGSVDLEPSNGCLQVGDPPLGLAAALLALPSFEEPYAIRIVAPVEKTVILPRVVLLDGQYRVTRSFGADAMKRRGTQMSFEVFINADNTAEKYALIYADPAHIGDSDRRTVSRTDSVFVGTGVLYLGSELGSNVTALDTGNIIVSLLGDRFEKLRRGN
jgi:hypothetical protein